MGFFDRLFNTPSREGIEQDMDTVDAIEAMDMEEMEEADPVTVTALHNLYGEAVTRLHEVGYRMTFDHLWVRRK